MAAYKSNRLLMVLIAVFGVVGVSVSLSHYDSEKNERTERGERGERSERTEKPAHSTSEKSEKKMPHPIRNTASQDSAAESLDTLTAQWMTTEQRINSLVETNTHLQQENKTLLQQLQDKTNKTDQTTNTLTNTLTQLQSQVQTLTAHPDIAHLGCIRYRSTHPARARTVGIFTYHSDKSKNG